MKAIVIDILNNEAALLKEDGSILKVADQGFQIGQEVMLEYAGDKEKATTNSGQPVNKLPHLHTRHIGRGIIAATLAATLLVATGICAYAMPYGTVTDEDSSVEYTINVFDRVIDVNATDEHGENLLADAENHKNKKIGDVLKETCKAGTSIRVETGSEHHDKKLTEELNQIIEDTVNNEDNTSKGPFKEGATMDPADADMIENGETDHKEQDSKHEKPQVHEPLDTIDPEPQNSTEPATKYTVPETNRDDDLNPPSDDITNMSEPEMSVPQEPASKEKKGISENNEIGAAGSAPESASAPEVPADRPEINESGEPPKERKSEGIPSDGDRRAPAEQSTP